MLPEIANDRRTIEAIQADPQLKALRQELLVAIGKYRYTYNFTWFGRPVIQLPDDLIALQELILSVRPELIVETGVAHGGLTVFAASILEWTGRGNVVGIDIDIRPPNREAIDRHPMKHRIRLIQGSSVSPDVVAQVREQAAGRRTMVLLDSNHTHDHVRQELELYAPLVGAGSYVVVYDTAIEDLPEGYETSRPWGKGNNPKTAVWEFLKTNPRFEIDKEIEDKLLMTVAPDGYLKCIRD